MNLASVVRSLLGVSLVLTPLAVAAGVRPAGEPGAESRASEGRSNVNTELRQGPNKSARYRFVNLNRVLEGWSKAKKMQEEFMAEFERRGEGLRARLTDLEKKNQEMRSFQASGASEEFKKRAREVALAAAELKYDEEQIKKDKADQRLRILLSSYQQIQSVVAKWSTEHDVDAVFVIQEEDSAEGDLLGRYERALVRQVLWYSKDLDISDDVVKLLEVSSPAPQSRPANSAPGIK